MYGIKLEKLFSMQVAKLQLPKEGACGEWTPKSFCNSEWLIICQKKSQGKAGEI